jgi:outer membrane biosynthesis protein TonB
VLVLALAIAALPFALALAGCAHQKAKPVDIEVPNWLSYGRLPGGARVTYPDDAWKAGVEGETVSEICLDERGKTIALQGLSGPAPLQAAALAALATWRFEPMAATPGGEPTRVCFRKRFLFVKSPPPETFYRTEGEMTVTRQYTPPVLDVRPNPTAPDAHGTFYVRLCVQADGTVSDVTVMDGGNRMLNTAISHELAAWQARPAVLAGQPVTACEIVRLELP